MNVSLLCQTIALRKRIEKKVADWPRPAAAALAEERLVAFTAAVGITTAPLASCWATALHCWPTLRRRC